MSEERAPAHRRRAFGALLGSRPLVLVSVALAALVFSALYLAEERAFPYWDYAAYQDQAYAVTDAFARSFGDGVALVAGSMNDDYNKLLTVPLVPFLALFGESRLVYVWAIVLAYFVPFLVVVAAIARRVFREHAAEAGTVAVVMTVLTPLAWRNIVQGYADLSGAVAIGVMILLYDRSAHAARWRPVLLCGVCAALAILLRRHYVFAVFAFYAAFFADVVLAARAGRWGAAQWLRSLAALTGSGIVALGVLTAVAPHFVQRVMSPAYAQYLVPWQMPASAALIEMVAMLGVLMLVPAVAGMVLLRRVAFEGRALGRVIVIATVTWVLVWGLWVRQAPTHYPHALPFFMAIGLTAFWLNVRALADETLRAVVSWVTAIVLVTGALVSLPVAPPLVALANALPRYAAPDTELPLVNPGYDEIARLVYYLRARAGASDEIVVAASSPNFNYDVLHEAERTLIGPRRAMLQIVYTPQVDSGGEAPPADALSRAKFVLVAEPFQHHLAAEQQKNVHVLTEAFDRHWRAADDFRLLPERFALEPGVSLLVYERTRKASVAVALDTQQRMAEYVRQGGTGQRQSAVAGWVVVSSPYTTSVSPGDGDASAMLVNPAREEQEPKTVLVHPEDRMDDVRISGEGRLIDERCAGAQIVFASEYRGPKLTAPTAFAPNAPPKRFDVLVRHVHGNPIYMKVDHAAASPHNVDYCTLSLDRVEVKRAGGAVDPRTARALRSDADPFQSAAASQSAARAATPAAAAAQPVAWTRKSSPFPMDIAPSASGTYVFSGHPTRAGQQPETVIEMGPTAMQSVRLTGVVRFYARQCKGAQIVAGTDYDGAATTTVVGVFTPSAGGSRFDTVVRDTGGKTVYLNFKANPRNPQDIDFCTMRIDDLRVAAAAP